MSVSHEIRFYKKNAQHYIASENCSLINFFDDWTWVLPNFGLPIVPLLLFIENWIWEPALDCIIVCKHPFWMNETGAFVPLRTFFLVFCWEPWEFSGQPFGFWFSKTYYGFSTYQLSNFYLCFYLILPSLNTIYNKYLTLYVICVENNSNC
jgi:hypothetical protein